MGYRPTERDRYVAKIATYGEQWDRIDAAMLIPPSLEVFQHGLDKARAYMGRIVGSEEYTGWLIEWAQTNPMTMKEAP